MTDTSEHEHLFDATAGNLGLAFANTVGGSRERPREKLLNYADLLAWSEQAGGLTAAEAAGLRQAAARRPAVADAVYRQALALREAIYRLFSAVAAGNPPPPAELAALNAALAEALPHRRIAYGEHGFVWEWDEAPAALDRPLWAVPVATAELLTEGELDRVRECASDTCGWLFLDQSRNRSRRWCDMSDCGNRAKARRHYERQRAARTGRQQPA